MALLAAQAPRLESAWLAAKMAGHSLVAIDRTLIETDRVKPLVPPPGRTCGGPVSTPTTAAPFRSSRLDGWPLWTTRVWPGREHDITALRAQPEILAALATWVADELPALGDLGYESESGTITVGFK